MNILVLGMGSNVSQGITKAIREIKGIQINVIGACIANSSVGLYMCDEAIISPLASDEGFVSWLIDVCKKKTIDIVFTGVEENINTIVYHRELFESQCKSKFVFPNKESWNIGHDKYMTCLWLKKHCIPYPQFALASDDLNIAKLITQVGFPLIAKPRCGKSSHGIIKAEAIKDLYTILGNNEYIIQEYIGNEEDEYTVGCYFSKRGELQSKIIMHRYLKNGGTSMAQITNNSQIEEVVDQICNNLNMTGPLNLQFRIKNDGTPICFEWNVRYSGTTAIRNHFGFRDVEAAIREYVLDEDISKCFQIIEKGVALRMDTEVYYTDYDFEKLYLEKLV